MVEPSITKNVSKTNGKEYNNLNLKTRVVNGKILQGIDPDSTEGIIVERTQLEGLKVVNPLYKKPSYSCMALYKGQEVSFFLTEKEHQEFVSCGGIGDKVRLTLDSMETNYNNNKRTIFIVRSTLL